MTSLLGTSRSALEGLAAQHVGKHVGGGELAQRTRQEVGGQLTGLCLVN